MQKKYFLDCRRILCLSPHPDDVEYSMSGTIMRYPGTHFDILCLTQGGMMDKTTGEHRIQEIRNTWKKAGVKNVSLYFSDYKFLNDMRTDEWVNFIEENYISKHLYDCILTPSEQDSHPEHVIVAGLSLSLCRSIAFNLVQYKSPSTLHGWIPNLFVPLEDKIYNTKLEILLELKSQLSHRYFNLQSLNSFHTDFNCLKRNIKYSESFKILTLYDI